MTANKTLPTPQNVQRFIASLPDEKRRSEAAELVAMMQEITGLQPTMWGSSIIGFGTYHYVYESGREGDTMVIGFAPRKAQLVLYSVVHYDQNAELAEQLGPHSTGKGCLYIKDLAKIDKSILRQMITFAYDARSQK